MCISRPKEPGWTNTCFLLVFITLLSDSTCFAWFCENCYVLAVRKNSLDGANMTDFDLVKQCVDLGAD